MRVASIYLADLHLNCLHLNAAAVHRGGCQHLLLISLIFLHCSLTRFHPHFLHANTHDHTQDLGPTELISLVWACARMGRGPSDDYGPSAPLTENTSNTAVSGSHEDEQTGLEADICLGALEAGEGDDGVDEEVQGEGDGSHSMGSGTLNSRSSDSSNGRISTDSSTDSSSDSTSINCSTNINGSSSSSSTDSNISIGQVGGGQKDLEQEARAKKNEEEEEGTLVWHSGHHLRLSPLAAKAVTRACSARLSDLDACQFSMLLISLPRLGMWLPQVSDCVCVCVCLCSCGDVGECRV